MMYTVILQMYGDLTFHAVDADSPRAAALQIDESLDYVEAVIEGDVKPVWPAVE